jgi:PIN domain nuclease of toxin-antitoxin system
MTKDDFLVRYNLSRTIDEALSKAISASVQHNRLYNNATNNSRAKIRAEWSKLLISISKRYCEENWNEDLYELEILHLKESMNLRFTNLINFRVSHSQKSISVFFKHLWCLDKIPVPPKCPVDRIILTRANAPYNQRSWGYIDDIETHRERYHFIREAAIRDGFDNVSQWELENFN